MPKPGPEPPSSIVLYQYERCAVLRRTSVEDDAEANALKQLADEVKHLRATKTRKRPKS